MEAAVWSLGRKWWDQKNNPDRPWAGLDIPVHPNTSALFAISAVTTMGNGSNTLFWMDCWLLGTSLAPNVHKSVPTRVRNSRTIADALIDHSWVSDIRGALSWHGLMEYLELCDAVSNIQLWYLLLQISLQIFFRWCHRTWTMEKDLENLCSQQMQDLCLACCP